MKKIYLWLMAAAMVFGFAGVVYAVPIVNPAGMGDALIGEFYRVDFESGYITFFSVTNTSNKFVTIHVRLRSGRFSVEVWDKQYILTPYDKIWFQLEQDPVTGLAYIWGEQIPFQWPLSTQLLEDLCFMKAEWATPVNTTQGYIEVFGIGQADTATENPTLWDDDVDNALMGHVYLGSFATGEYLSYNMTAIHDFRTAGPVHRDGSTRGIIDKHGLWGYEEPDWATTYGPSWNDGDPIIVPTGPALVHPLDRDWSIHSVERALAKCTIQSDYFNRAHGTDGLTTTMGIITFPAKYLHWNFLGWSDTVMGNSTLAQARRAAGPPCTVKQPASIPANAKLWNMDEDQWIYSPSGMPPLQWEVNTIPIGDLSFANFPTADWFLNLHKLSDPLLPAFPFNASSTGYEGYPMGWFLINMPWSFGNWALTTDPRVDPWDNTLGLGIYPAANLMTHYEELNYKHARGYQWNWVWCDVPAIPE